MLTTHPISLDVENEPKNHLKVNTKKEANRVGIKPPDFAAAADVKEDNNRKQTSILNNVINWILELSICVKVINFLNEKFKETMTELKTDESFSSVFSKLLGFFKGFITEFITEHRGWFVIFFVLPLSLVFDFCFYVRAKAIHRFYSAPKAHEKRLNKIQTDIKAWIEANKDNESKPRLCTARGGWQSICPTGRGYKNKCHQISVNLYDILELDEENMLITCEPMVTMGQLSHFLIPQGYTIPVLPELDDLTVGGLYMGVGIETSSHKYGLFNDTIVEAEVVLASGEVVTCSKSENAELFDALPWSYGTLGFLTSVKIRVVQCKSFLRLKYIPFHNIEFGIEKFRNLSSLGEEETPEFIEALVYSDNSIVVMEADYVDEKEVEWSKRNSIGLWYKPWFYKHVESILEERKIVTEYIPIRDYYHRHTKSIFWELEQIIPVGNHPVFRFLLGWAVPPKISFLKLTQTQTIRDLYEKQHVIQDMLVPISKMGQSLDVFKEHYDLYPLWVCPYRAYDHSKEGVPHRGFLRKPEEKLAGKNYELYVDLGAYGIPKAVLEKRPFDAREKGIKVEQYVKNIKGYQMLYANSYLKKNEFYEMFDHTHYFKMKKKYDPNSTFPEVYDKVYKASNDKPAS